MQEAQECNGLQFYLEELELDKASQKTVLLDEKYATDTLCLRLKHLIKLIAVHNEDQAS